MHTKNLEINRPNTSKSARELQRILQVLLEDYGLKTKTLAKLLGVESSALEQFYGNTTTIPHEKEGFFMGLLLTLDYVLKITPDDRTKSIVQTLIQRHGMNTQTLAHLSQVTQEELEGFLHNPLSISWETKYKIASISMCLHVLLNPLDNHRL